MRIHLVLLLAGGLCAAPDPADKAAPDGEKRQASSVPAARSRMSAAAQRNENVPVYQIDNNAIKEANIRLGNSVSVISDVTADRSFFGSEFGQAPSAIVAPAQLIKRPSWHAEAFEWHQNSVFNARTFFQVGDVKPSHRNFYGGRFTTNLGSRTYLSGDASQRKIRGMVNGNVLVPLASERMPKATDPAVYSKVASFLAAFPNELPNRSDFDIRALNTNSPQIIDQVIGTLRLDTDVTAASRLTFSYNINRMREDAFQFVAGMNPDTDIHSHRAQIGFTMAPDAQTDVALGLVFQRTRSALTLEPNAVGPRVRVGYQIQDLGPDSEFPVNRALNSFRGGGHATRRVNGGRHTLSFGADLTRYQINSEETRDQRGYFAFGNNFGRTAIDNFLYGAPSFFEISLGYMPRGFRSWSANTFIADRWQLHPKFQLYYGVRYSLLTRPVEVNNLDRAPYGCDCNNFSPRVGFAWQVGWNWVMRASYGVSFSEIQPFTYQQVRNNLPLIRDVQVQNPDFVNPLRGIQLNEPNGRTVPTLISPDLVSPYAHHYTFGLERKLSRETQLRFAYVGSRGVKLLNSYIMNRADPVPGIPLTLDTVDVRRPDQRYYETVHIVNGGLAYFDAGQVSVDTAPIRGLRTALTYTFSKAIDEGVDYTATAANRDVVKGRSQWQYDNQIDKRGLSNFDSTHALQMSYTYDLPRLAQPGGMAAHVLNGWQFAGAVLMKTGTPLTLYIGSDAPGFGNVDGGPSDRPNIIDPSILGATISHPDIAATIISRDRFGYIAPGEHRGSVGRNTFRKAHIGNWNASLNKRWQWGGSREWTLLLRAEAYNLTNTPQFDEPQRNLTSPSFGRITNTLNDGRVFQLGLQFVL